RARNFVEIDRLHLEADCIQTRYPQKLRNEPIHTRDICPQLAELAIALHGIECAGDNSEWSAQLMCSIGGELTLCKKSPLQPIKRMIDRLDQWLDLCGQISSREPDECGTRPNGRRYARNFSDRFQPTPDDKNPDRQGCKHEERTDPGYIEHELAKNRADKIIRAGSTRNRDGYRSDCRVELHAEAVVVG